MVKGATFDKQLMTSEEFAHQVNYFYQGEMGVTKGCDVTANVDDNLVVSDGFFTIYGRLLHNIGDTIVTVPAIPSGTLYSILIFEVDLSKENTIETFNQGEFKIVSNDGNYPVLRQDNLDDKPQDGVYQLEFARFKNTVAGIIDLEDTKNILSLEMYAKQSDFNTHLAESANKHIKSSRYVNGGYVIEYDDGTLIQIKSFRYTGKIVDGWGTLFSTANLTLGSWPIPFSGVPYRFIDVKPLGTVSVWTTTFDSPTTTQMGTASLVRPTASDTIASYDIDVYGVWRWKA